VTQNGVFLPLRRRSQASASGARSRRPARKPSKPRQNRSAPTSSVLLAPHQRIEELREESEDGYASDSTTDSYSNNDDDYDDDDNVAAEADTEDQPSPSTEQPGVCCGLYSAIFFPIIQPINWPVRLHERLVFIQKHSFA
jgi:hypothetical protein